MTGAARKLLAAFLLTALTLGSAALYLRLNTVRIVVYHTNDIHGWIMPHGAPKPERSWFSRFRRKQGPEGGMAALAALLGRSPKGYLLVDSGDFLTGTPEVDLSRGDAAIDCMNQLGVQACEIGNHDFDQGQANLRRLSELAKFPFLCANLEDDATAAPPDYVRPYMLRDIGGLRVAIIGLITADTPRETLPGNVKGLYFEPEADALRKTVREVRQAGAKVVIVASHVGFEGEKVLADRIVGVDLILGGHTHAGFTRPYRDPRNGTLIVHNRSELRTVTRTELLVWKRNGRILDWSYRLISLAPARQGEDPAMKAIVERYRARVAPEMDAPIGVASAPLDRKGPETTVGDWQTDILRWYTKSDIAFQNLGGIRADLPAGPVTPRRIYEMEPFPDTLVTLELTGEQVRSVLERAAPGVLQFSGLRAVYDLSPPAGGRVAEATVDGRPLDPGRGYRVALNSFLAAGGDGFDEFLEGRNRRDSGILLRDLFLQFVKKYSPVSSKIDGRIAVSSRAPGR